MKRLLLWSAALLGAGVIGGFIARLLWPQHEHPSSLSSADRFAEATRKPFGGGGGSGRVTAVAIDPSTGDRIDSPR
jgi:hypothetical protein